MHEALRWHSAAEEQTVPLRQLQLPSMHVRVTDLVSVLPGGSKGGGE